MTDLEQFRFLCRVYDNNVYMYRCFEACGIAYFPRYSYHGMIGVLFNK